MCVCVCVCVCVCESIRKYEIAQRFLPAGDFLDIPPEKSTQNSTVSGDDHNHHCLCFHNIHCFCPTCAYTQVEAQLVIVDLSDACSPTVQATVTIPGIIEPDIVKITVSDGQLCF